MMRIERLWHRLTHRPSHAIGLARKDGAWARFERRYAATVGDALLDGSVIGRPDLFDSIYETAESGLLSAVVGQHGPENPDALARTLTAVLWRAATRS